MKNKKEIAFRDNTIVKESLPFPIVYYPGFYGAFFAFRESNDATTYLCTCSKNAVENFIEYKLRFERIPNINGTKDFIIDSMYFPIIISTNLMKENVIQDKNIIKSLHFRKELCHECNNKVPSYNYCHKMYGTMFTQTFGWYINQQYFEYGIIPIHNYVLEDKCPNYILKELLIKPSEYRQFLKENSEKPFDSPEISSFQKKYFNQFKKIHKIIENEVRRKFGYKEIGKRGKTSELILYQIIKSIFSRCTIIHNYRPNFLNGMELDIFVKEMNIGIEYQGEQHFKPIEHWGGEKSLSELKKRDKLKKLLCKKNHISLYTFDYRDGLNEELVRSRLQIPKV